MATQTVEQVQRLAPFMEDYIRKLLESAYQRVQEEDVIPPQEVADLTDRQKQAGTLVDKGIGAYQPLLDKSQGLIESGSAMLSDPNAYKDFMNPYTSDVIANVGRDIAEQTRMQQNQLGASATGSGAFGGARQGLASGEIAGAGLRSFGDAAANLRRAGFMDAQNLVGARAAGLGSMGGQLAGLAGQTQQMGQQDIANLLGIGSLEQQQAQAVLDTQRANFMAQQDEPYRRFGFFSDLLRGVPTTSSTVGISTLPNQSLLSQIGGVAATGLGLAGQLGYKPFASGSNVTSTSVA